MRLQRWMKLSKGTQHYSSAKEAISNYLQLVSSDFLENDHNASKL